MNKVYGYSNVNFLTFILYYNYIRYCHWEKLVEGNTRFFCILFETYCQSAIVSK